MISATGKCSSWLRFSSCLFCRSVIYRFIRVLRMHPRLTYRLMRLYTTREKHERSRGMLIYEYKLAGTKQQYAAIDEALRIVQFIRNKCLRLWMDERGITKNDLQCYCAVLAKQYP